jgi:hypothetical protein
MLDAQSSTDGQLLWNECAVYQPFLDAGKPQIQLEYSDKIAERSAEIGQPITFTCGAAQEGVGKALYPTTAVNSAEITTSCPE